MRRWLLCRFRQAIRAGQACCVMVRFQADARCPMAQSEAYFVILKRVGKEVEMVRFPDSSHMPLRTGHPKMREEYLARTLAWFNKHL